MIVEDFVNINKDKIPNYKAIQYLNTVTIEELKKWVDENTKGKFKLFYSKISEEKTIYYLYSITNYSTQILQEEDWILISNVNTFGIYPKCMVVKNEIFNKMFTCKY